MMVQSVLKDTMFTAIFVAYFIYYIKTDNESGRILEQ